jgi:anti-anti-sigma factor
MPVQDWSDDVLLVELQDDPGFTDDVNAALESVETRAARDVVLNFAQITFLNSSNIAKLLKLRKVVVANNQRRLVLCGIGTHIWGVFLVTGLDKVFDFADNVSSGLATIQMGRS